MQTRNPREVGAHGDMERVSLVAGILPWVAVLAVTLSGLYVRVTFGRWPRVYRDWPEAPLTTATAVIVMLAVLSLPAMVSVAALLPVVRFAFGARPVFNRWALTSIVGTLVLYLLSTADPYGFVEWAFD